MADRQQAMASKLVHEACFLRCRGFTHRWDSLSCHHTEPIVSRGFVAKDGRVALPHTKTADLV